MSCRVNSIYKLSVTPRISWPVSARLEERSMNLLYIKRVVVLDIFPYIIQRLRMYSSICGPEGGTYMLTCELHVVKIWRQEIRCVTNNLFIYFCSRLKCDRKENMIISVPKKEVFIYCRCILTCVAIK